MQVKFFSAIVVLAASLVSAAPSKRDTPGETYYCSGLNWTGECHDLIMEFGYCQRAVNLLQTANATINSIGPSERTVCIGYANDACTGNPNWGFAFPGDASAGVDSGNPWNGNLLSFQCYSKVHIDLS